VNIEQLAELTVLNLESQPVRFGDLWKDRTAVIAFVRHWG
jgi:hypothetical protein